MRNGPEKSFTVPKIFVDTNPFVYSLEKMDGTKNGKARVILEKIIESHHSVISTQVIKKYYVAATTKMKVDKIVIKNIVHNFRNMEIVQSDLNLIEQTIDISVISQLSFWDSLIMSAAEKAKCEFVFSEDRNPGQTYRGAMLINHFEKYDF